MRHRARAAEEVLVNAEPREAVVARASAAALEGARPLAHNGYKVALISALMKQALREVTGAGGA